MDPCGCFEIAKEAGRASPRLNPMHARPRRARIFADSIVVPAFGQGVYVAVNVARQLSSNSLPRPCRGTPSALPASRTLTLATG